MQSPYWGHPETPYLDVNFTRMFELFTSFMKAQYQPQAPAWMLKPANPAIKQVSYNHIEQCYDFTTPKPLKMPAPRLRSFLENTKALHSKYRGDPNIAIGVLPANFFKGYPQGGARKKCDLCFFVRKLLPKHPEAHVLTYQSR